MYNSGVAPVYQVEIENAAARAIQRLQRHDQVRIVKKINALATDPRPSGCSKLAGTESAYRIRIGDCRVVYIVEDSVRIVTVTRVAHRREVYR